MSGIRSTWIWVFVISSSLVPFMLVECLAKKRPNIIFIMVDDMGWNDVSFHGSKKIPTPNIDALAKDGIILNNYYVQPLCTPSRGSLMTGKYPIKTGLQHRVIVADAPWGLSTKEKLLPQFLNEIGYVSHGVGKWHLGFFKEKYLPTRRGFESFFGYWTGVKDYYTHFSDMRNITGLDLHDGPISQWGYNGSYGTDLFTYKAKEVIEKHDGSKPLFLYVAQQAVHSGNFLDPLQAPDHYVRQFPHIKDSKRKIFAGMVSALDTSVGEIFSSLRKARMLDNTIVVFSTDNGGAVQGADGNSASNYPLRGSKYNMWEGGVRGVAFIWSAQLRMRSRVSEHMMHVCDWLPTLYSAAGGDVRRLGEIDGHNLWPSFMHDLPSPREEILLNIDPIWKVEGLRKKNYKILKGSVFEGRYDGWYDGDGKEMVEESEYVETPSALRKYRRTYGNFLKKSKVAKILLRKYRKVPALAGQCSEECKKQLVVECGPKPDEKELTCKPNEATCLFDVDKDPCEYHNLAEQLPEVKEEMETLLQKYREMAVPPRNKDSDPLADPKLHGDAWVPWK